MATLLAADGAPYSAPNEIALPFVTAGNRKAACEVAQRQDTEPRIAVTWQAGRARRTFRIPTPNSRIFTGSKAGEFDCRKSLKYILST
jgi:hypothetical protein